MKVSYKRFIEFWENLIKLKVDVRFLTIPTLVVETRELQKNVGVLCCFFTRRHGKRTADTRPHLEDVPVHDGPPGVLHHLLPVLQLQPLPVVANLHPADGIWAACLIGMPSWLGVLPCKYVTYSVIVRHHQLQADSLGVIRVITTVTLRTLSQERASKLRVDLLSFCEMSLFCDFKWILWIVLCFRLKIKKLSEFQKSMQNTLPEVVLVLL